MKRFRQVFRSERGFTLIELLVVIAVLGILATIAVPRITGVREEATEAAARANLRTIQTALEIWFTNNNSYPTAWNTKDEDDNAFSTYVSVDTSDYTFTESSTSSSYEITVDYNDDNAVDLTLTPSGITPID
ncbi:prepilin-type N-terminal cleavage/methylation domain-containing protein [Halocella sp. SP3-1]|uniref:type II secretion system protein n=1 Tax=Halocella sp. SP3-1 TaxID=2382161 RepID=UPI000F75AD6E|nr:prepilin-type N-terminal cleavage/methylation domain-containing protein [Halocella sp. SP3-1]AZO95691.1 prepilin-type N-terminal cleavage/methylation domain-containing protein [Halocella sp. SP3-1]